MSLLKTAERLEAVADLVGRVAAWATLAMVAVVSFNVVTRYTLHWGTVWLQELEWHLLAPIALFGMTYTLRHGEHVRVDMLYERMPPRARHLLDCLSSIVIVVVAVMIINFSINYVNESWRIREFSPDPGGLPARYALKALIPIGFVLLALQGVVMALRHAVLLVHPEAHPEAEETKP